MTKIYADSFPEKCHKCDKHYNTWERIHQRVQRMEQLSSQRAILTDITTYRCPCGEKHRVYTKIKDNFG